MGRNRVGGPARCVAQCP